MNPLNILVVCADPVMRAALGDLIGKTNRFPATVTFQSAAAEAMDEIDERSAPFDAVVCSNDAKTDPKALSAFMHRHGIVDSLIVVELGEKPEDHGRDADPLRCCALVEAGHGLIDRLLRIIQTVGLTHQKQFG